MALVAGCSDDEGTTPALTTESTRDDPSTSTGASSPSSTDDLIEAIGCSNDIDREVDPGEPVEPTSAVNCALGESQIGIQIYATNDDRDAVMAYLHQFAGSRVVGQRWIIAVDTPEAAETVSELTGGEHVTLAGTLNGGVPPCDEVFGDGVTLRADAFDIACTRHDGEAVFFGAEFEDCTDGRRLYWSTELGGWGFVGEPWHADTTSGAGTIPPTGAQSACSG